MPWQLVVAPGAERTLARLPASVAAAVVEFMVGPLLDNPHRVGKPLRRDFEGYLSARRGQYRIVYRIDESDHIVRVVKVQHRRDVYRSR